MENNTVVKENKELLEQKSMKEKLDAQKKVAIKIPLDPLNPKDSFVPVCINGYVYQIKRGEKVEVPETVYEVLEQAKYI